MRIYLILFTILFSKSSFADLVPDITRYNAASSVFYNKNTSRENRIVDSYLIADYYYLTVEMGLSGPALQNELLNRATDIRINVQNYRNCIVTGKCDVAGAKFAKTVGSTLSKFGAKYGLNIVYDLGMSLGGERNVDGWFQRNSRSNLSNMEFETTQEIHKKLTELMGKNEFVAVFNQVRSESPNGGEFKLGLDYNQLKEKLTDKEQVRFNAIISMLEQNQDLLDKYGKDVKSITALLIKSSQANAEDQANLRNVLMGELAKIEDAVARENLRTRVEMGDIKDLIQVLLKENYSEKELIAKYGKAVLDEVKKLQLENHAAKEIERLRQLEQARYQSVMSSIEEAEVGIAILTNLLNFKNPELAQKLNAISSIVLNLAKMQTAFNHNQTNMTAAALTGNYVLAGIQLFSMFSNKPGPSAEQILMDAIAEIGKQIQDLGLQMHQRFNFIDFRLSQIHSDLLREFNKVHQGLAMVYQQSVAIRQQLESLNSQLVASEQRVREDLRTILAEETEQCRTRFIVLNQTPTESEFRACEARFYNWLANISENSLVNPRYTNGELAIQRIKALSINPKESGLDSEIAHAFSRVNYVYAASTGENDTQTMNAIEWLRGVKLLRTLWERNPKIEPGVDNQLILAPLQNLKNSLQLLHNRSKNLLENLLSKYQEKTNLLKIQLKELRSQNIQSNFSPFADIPQSPNSRGVLEQMESIQIHLPVEKTPVPHCSAYGVQYKNSKIDLHNELLSDVVLSIDNLRQAFWESDLKDKIIQKYMFANELVEHEICFSLISFRGFNRESLIRFVNDFKNTSDINVVNSTFFGNYMIVFNSIFKPTPKYFKFVRQMISDQKHHQGFKDFLFDSFNNAKIKSPDLDFKTFIMNPLNVFHSVMIPSDFVGELVQRPIQGLSVTRGHSTRPGLSINSSLLTDSSFQINTSDMRKRFENSMQAVSSQIAQWVLTRSIVINSHNYQVVREDIMALREVKDKFKTANVERIFKELLNYDDSRMNNDFANAIAGNISIQPQDTNHLANYYKSLESVRQNVLSIEADKLLIKNILFLLFPDELLEDDFVRAFLNGDNGIIGKEQLYSKALQNEGYNYNFRSLYEGRILDSGDQKDWLDQRIDIFSSEIKRLIQNHKVDSNPLPAPLRDMEIQFTNVGDLL